MSPRVKKTGSTFPTRLLTAPRRIKILQFKNLCKKTTTDYGVTGSETWMNSLLEFMSEGRTLTIDNVIVWIRLHPWITADDPGFNSPETSNDVHVMPRHLERNGLWAEDQESQVSTLSSQFSGATHNTGHGQHDNNHTQHIEPYTFPIGWTQLPHSMHQHQHQRHGNLQIYNSTADNSDSGRNIYLTPNDQGNANQEIGDANTNNLYSEEVLVGLTEVMKHLAHLNKHYTKLECVRTLLFPLHKMVKTVERNIRRCTMPKQHKDALAAKTVQLRQIKVEHWNGQERNHLNQPSTSPAAIENGNQMDEHENFQLDQIDICDQ